MALKPTPGAALRGSNFENVFARALLLSPKKTWQNSTKAIRMTLESAFWPVPPINFVSEAGLLREFY
jgi:hypothetical protein